MRRIIVGVAAVGGLGLLAAGGYAWALHEGQAELTAATDRINAAVKPGGSFSYATSAVHPFLLGADLERVTLRLPDGTLYTADHVRVSGAWGGRVSFLHAENLRGVGGALYRPLTAAALDGKNISGPEQAVGTAWDPTTATFGQLTVRNVAVAEGRTARLATVRIGNYGVGRHSTLELDDLSLFVATSPTVSHVIVSRLASTGVDLASAVKAYRAGTSGGQSSSMPSRLEMDGFSIGPGTTRTFAIGKAMVLGSKDPADSVTRVRVDMADVVCTLPMQASQQVLENILGGNVIKASVHQEFSYTRAGGVLDMSPMTIRMKGIGTLGVAIRLSGLNARLVDGGMVETDKPLAPPVNMQLSSASVFFQDGGFLERAADAQARRFNLSEGEVRARFANAIARDPRFAVLPGGDGMRSAISDFLLHGGRLGVTMNPPSPLGMVPLAGLEGAAPATVVTTLGLVVTHEGSGALP